MAPTLPLLPIALLTLTFNHAFATPIPQNGDGGGSGSLPDGGLGYDPASAGDTVPGADGTDTGGVQLSKGAIIAIAVVAGLVVITGSSCSLEPLSSFPPSGDSPYPFPHLTPRQ